MTVIDPLIKPYTLTIPLRSFACGPIPSSAARLKAISDRRLIHNSNIDTIDAAIQPYLAAIDNKIEQYREMMLLGQRSPRYRHACKGLEWWKHRRIVWEVEKWRRCRENLTSIENGGGWRLGSFTEI